MGRNEKFDKDIKEGVKLTRKGSVKCVCGCSVSYRYFNKFGWGTCERCGRRVEKPKDKFKNKLKDILKGSDNYG